MFAGAAGVIVPPMPRLVSLTLLSVLVLPAATLVYVVCFAFVGQVLRGNTDTGFLIGGMVSFGVVVAWWAILWGRQVTWTARRWARTVIFTLASVAVGIVAGLLPLALVRGGAEFGLFIGGLVCVLSWLVCACVVWRDDATPQTADGHAAADVIACPKCGYALNGLREARCPECGEVYTLDGLFAAQVRRDAADLAGA